MIFSYYPQCGMLTLINEFKEKNTRKKLLKIYCLIPNMAIFAKTESNFMQKPQFFPAATTKVFATRRLRSQNTQHTHENQ